MINLCKLFKRNTCNKVVPILQPVRWEDTTPFTVPITHGQVIKVYDGDTITIASRLPYTHSPLYRFSVRLHGIDTPEIRGKEVSQDQKNAAIAARNFVSKLTLGKTVDLKNIGSDKYGRVLADVYIGDIHLNKLLLDCGFARPYDGKEKKAFSESWKRAIDKAIQQRAL